MNVDENNDLAHYGTKRHSGRYPYGSGEDAFGSGRDFLSYVDAMKKEGLDEATIAKGVGLKSSTQLRNMKSLAKKEIKSEQIAEAEKLKAKGYSPTAIGKKMGLNESSARALLDPAAKEKNKAVDELADLVRNSIETKKYVDIGAGVEHHLEVTRTKLDNAIAKLELEGYNKYYIKVPQIGTGLNTSLKVLAKPDVEYSEVRANRDHIQQIFGDSISDQHGFFGIQKPLSLDAKRVGIRYAEQGGTKADGVIFVRPNTKSVSLGSNRYAQVRIAVNGTHYLKGMAVYKDGLPEGVDVVFNTNKSDTGNKLDAMKPMKTIDGTKDGPIDESNPFGSSIKRQIGDDIPGAFGIKKLTSTMNIVNEEGDWEKWNRNLSTQFLSKQSTVLAKAQLDLTARNKRAEFEEIMTANNPEVRKKLLGSFADDMDSSAVHLKAAALPRQKTRVLFPLNKIAENEIYAPDFRDGEPVVLVRYPHGGIFEIPELRVNNRNPEGRKLLGVAPRDAVGIHHKVAERLSGADFDGDTVLVIPNPNGRIKNAPALKGLIDFDPKIQYKKYEGMPVMSERMKQTEMGKISNLITDMTIRRAPFEDIARAVRHSMVVIDAAKHELNYTQSYKDNNVAQLKTKYQGSPTAGAKTLISRSGTSSTIRVNQRRDARVGEGGAIDRTTGARRYVETGETYVNPQGKTVHRTEEVARLANVDDAHKLSSGTPIERLYAEHSNDLKKLGNEARLVMINTTSIPYSSAAKLAYASQVGSLTSKLKVAQKNAPLERHAQVLANGLFNQKKAEKPGMDKDEEKKVKFQALEIARVRVGASKSRIRIDADEWAAIQAGAITKQMLNNILDNSDLDQVKALATPRTKQGVASGKLSQARTMLANGHSRADIADALGISTSTLDKALNPSEEG